MKPRLRKAIAQTPDGGEIMLFEHDGDFSIQINGQELMQSRQHESELALAQLGCSHLINTYKPSILIGGLGLGYTLRQVLDMLGPNTKVVVSELVHAVVEWNLDFLSELNNRALEDNRVEVHKGNVINKISQSKNRFDAILLDVDNGPSALSDVGNHRLYNHEGIRSCRLALREKGVLAVWSAESNKKFEQLLISCHFHVRRFRVAAYKASKSQYRFVWVASLEEAQLPLGGGAPRPSSY